MPNIVLKDRNGNPVTFSPPVGVKLLGADGELIPLIPKDAVAGGDFYIIYMNEDGTETLYTRPIMYGDTAGDVIALGLLETPTKEATETEEHIFLGWAATIGGTVETAMFENVAKDLTVYAVFKTTAIVASGTCGDTAAWRLNADGVFTVSGEGAMYDYETATDRPWNGYAADVKSVIVEEGITHVGKRSFNLCANLTDAKIAESVTTLGTHIFSACSSLVNVNIPHGVADIPMSLLYDCASLTSIDIPDGVTSIGNYAFYGCGSLTSIDIPDGVTSIGYSAFYNCSGLTSIDIPDGVTSIGHSAFYNCSGLTSIDIPDGVTSIGAYTFLGCASLTSITIPSGATSIGAQAFAGCTGLTSITIPSGATSIGPQAFSSCTNLTTAVFETTTGWTATHIAGGTYSIASSSLENTSTAATYLKSTYNTHNWKRS